MISIPLKNGLVDVTKSQPTGIQMPREKVQQSFMEKRVIPWDPGTTASMENWVLVMLLATTVQLLEFCLQSVTCRQRS